MIGVVDVGGGLRGIYGAGVFDYCIENGIRFDYCIGVSAGAANLCSLQAGQKGRNYAFYTEYSKRPEYMGFGLLLKTGSFIGLDYIYRTLSNSGGENPLDYDAMTKDPAPLKIVATNAITAKPVYFDKLADMKKDDYSAICASCCVPAVNKPYMIDGVPYYDGGLSDAVPFEKAFEDGCDKVVLVLTKTRDFVRDPAPDLRMARFFMPKKYPASIEALKIRAKVYNDAVARAKKLEKEGKLLILAPDETGRLKTLTKDYRELDAMYEQGRRHARLLEDFV